MRLSLPTLQRVAPGVTRPSFAPDRLKTGIVHLGVGAFHRAHQAVYTDDAIAHSGGDWGIFAVSMRQPTVARTLAAQDCLYAVEQVSATSSYRVIGAVREAATLPHRPQAVIDALAADQTRIATLTVTEKGYCLGADGLDFNHPDILHDCASPLQPRSAIGALVAGLAKRHAEGGRPMTVISCDNLTGNGPRLQDAVVSLAARLDPVLASWIWRDVAFPETMVDSIVPASDEASRARVDAVLGMEDHASVQRETFADRKRHV